MDKPLVFTLGELRQIVRQVFGGRPKTTRIDMVKMRKMFDEKQEVECKYLKKRGRKPGYSNTNKHGITQSGSQGS